MVIKLLKGVIYSYYMEAVSSHISEIVLSKHAASSLLKFAKKVKVKPIQTYTQTSVKLTKTKQDWGCHSSELSY